MRELVATMTDLDLVFAEAECAREEINTTWTMAVSVCNKKSCLSLVLGERVIEERVLVTLKEILPQAHNYIICSCKGNETEFDAVIRVDITEKEQAVNWKATFESKTKTTWRTDRTHPGVQKKVLFKEEYRCQHNTKSHSSKADSRRSSKNTNCMAKLQVTINNPVVSRWKTKDPHRLEHPTMIYLLFHHNHPIHAASALKHRDVSKETQTKIDQLLLNGYAPAAALEKFKFDLQLEDPVNYITISGDRALCPDLSWVYRRSYALGQERYGRNDSTESLKVFIQSINSNFPQETITCQEDSTTKDAAVDFAKMDMTEEGQMIVAICTPLMRRVHRTLKHSGEIVFIDSTGNVDRTGVRVFLLVTHSCLGGLPLGVIITSSESTSTIKAGLKLLCSVVGPSGFFGRGQKGPLIFMTDDSRAERAAHVEIFPESGQLLCAFHLLQAFWRYIWDQKTQVHRDQRQHIFHLVKDIMYADNKEMMDRVIEKVLTDKVLSKYIHVKDYIKKNLLDRKSAWAICLREGLPIRGNNTNNFCEAAMRILKDQVLMRTKAFNPQQLVDFLCHDLEAYYGRKCIDIANGQLQKVQSSKYLINQEHITDDFITQVGGSKEMQFDVRSMRDPNVVYRVDMTVGFCTCRNGNTGGPCKHQANVIRKFQIPSWNFIPENNTEMRQIICYIGTGQYHASSWFDNLKSDTRSADNKLGEFVNAIHNEGSVSPKPEAQKSETYNVVSLSEGLKTLFDDWNNKLIQDPQSYAEGIDALLKNAKLIHTASQFNSAMSTLGKYSGFAFKANFKLKNHLVGSKRIGVQPTALQRRKKALPGCKYPGMGRPRQTLQLKHTLQKEKGEEVLSGASLPKRRKKAPHNLTECVSNNTSLGKNHAQK